MKTQLIDLENQLNGLKEFRKQKTPQIDEGTVEEARTFKKLLESYIDLSRELVEQYGYLLEDVNLELRRWEKENAKSD